MHLSRLTPALFEQYQRFWTERGLLCPGRPAQGIWVVENEVLLVGAALFRADGPYSILEWFSTNPSVSLRKRHQATEFLLKSTLVLVAILDQTIIMVPSPHAKGCVRIAARLGIRVGPRSQPMFAV